MCCQVYIVETLHLAVTDPRETQAWHGNDNEPLSVMNKLSGTKSGSDREGSDGEGTDGSDEDGLLEIDVSRED